MTTLQYKDYQGAVTYEDGSLLVQILHIDDCITTNCDSASAAQSAFEELVDDYIETCKAVGKEPSKPFKGTLNVRLGSVLHRNAALSAADIGETLNAWIAGAVSQRLRRDEMIKSVKAMYLTDDWASSFVHSSNHAFGFIQVGHANRHRQELPIAGAYVDAGKEKARQMLNTASAGTRLLAPRHWN